MSDEEISAGGSRIYRHDAPAGEPEIALGDEQLIEAVSGHVERHIGPIEQVFHELVSPTVHLDVLCVDPSDERPWFTLVTCGMSAKPMRAPEPGLTHAELALALPPDWPMEQEAWRDERHYWPIRLLKFLGRLPHEYDTWLGNGHTIPNDDPPAPYAPGTALCGAIVAAPQLPPESFGLLERPAGPVRFYGVVALHAAEMRFKLDRGADDLYDRLAAAGVSELVDPGRAAAVEAPRRRGLFRRR
jgi:hypothetical protein